MIVLLLMILLAFLAGCGPAPEPTPTSTSPADRTVPPSTPVLSVTPTRLTPLPTPSSIPSPAANLVECSVPGDWSQLYTVEDETGLVQVCEGYDQTVDVPPSLTATPDAEGRLDFWWIDTLCGDRIIRLAEPPLPTFDRGPPPSRTFTAAIIHVLAPLPSGLQPNCAPTQVLRGATIQLSRWTQRVPLTVSNATTAFVAIVVNGIEIDTVPPKEVVALFEMPPTPWDIEARSISGRVLNTLHVGSLDAVTNGQGFATRVDLACGRLDMYVGGPLLGPMFSPGPVGCE